MDKNEFEFSSLVTIDSIPADRNVTKTIEATPNECINLAKRLEIAKLSGLKAEIVLFRSSKSNILTVKGDIEVKIGQKCVISLKSIDSNVKIDFETSFSNGKEIIEGENLEYDDLEDDCNSPISDGNIDIGELVTQ
ncbi:MAG: hypothetical protein GY793_09120, partial [Proteobacteria bacterium]|nr:hypothetical protein [Pseudomonadota bacterium]